MNKRLRYEKINNSNDVISIDLDNGYSVIAMSGFNSELNTYATSLYIKENTIDTWRLIGAADKLIFNATEKTINSAILKTVSEFLENGFLQYYIDQYEFEEKLIDDGISRLEGETV